MWHLGSTANDEHRLAETWRAVQPFPHLVFDDLVAAKALPELFAILEEEPVDRYEGDIFAFEATAPEPRTEEFRSLRDAFGRALAPPLSRITVCGVARHVRAGERELAR